MKNIQIPVVVLLLIVLLPLPTEAASSQLPFQPASNLQLKIITPTPTPIPIRVLPSIPALPIFARIAYPNGDEDITIADTESDISFNYGGSFDKSAEGNYGYRLELWRNGQLLGNVDNFDRYPLDPNKTSVAFGWTPGQYFQKNSDQGTSGFKTAQAGDGYSVRVVITLAYTDPGSQVTKFKEIAEDTSDGTFTFQPKPQAPGVFTPESYSVAFTYPIGGENLILGKTIELLFDYTGTFDEEKSGTYNYRVELWQNGKLLGNIHNLTDFQLDISKTHVTYGFLPDNYFTKENYITKATKIAAGEGYQLRVVLMQSFTSPGSNVTQFRDLASDLSDTPFTFSHPSPSTLSDTIITIIVRPVTSFFSWIGNLFKK